MLYVSDLLRTPVGRRLTLVGGPWDAVEVTGVLLVDEPEELESAPPGSVAVLSRNATKAGSGPAVVETLRVAGRRRLAGLVLPGPSGASPEIVALARKVRVALLAGASGQTLSQTVFGLREAVRSEPGLLLRRTREAIERLGAIEGAGEDDILRAASDAVGVAYGVAALAESPATSVVIRVDGRADGYVCWVDDDPAAAIVAGVVATTLGRVRAAARAAEAERSQAVRELLRASASDLLAAARRARLAGVPVDGWHVTVFLRVPGTVSGTVSGTVPGTVPAAVSGAVPGSRDGGEGGQGLARYAAALARDDLGGPVLATAWQEGLLLVRTTDARPGRDPLDPGRVAELLPPGTSAGLGTCQFGPEGLRRAAVQARAAAVRAGPGTVEPFDRLGVHAVLAELAASDSAVMTARDMLAPLDGLGALAPSALPTLRAYLDTWGSRTKAAEILNLHPNAVAHRVRRITEALGLDLADPQTRFALHLACHVLSEAGRQECGERTTTGEPSL
ncbi:hypothetical protein Misp01_33280 [Microtetraspora sp. NBRC 13810]|uniref:helix-turn-helix domain-containing protein n=1 Tax=Microtetraspora sp. NBRC 13810 TaxID=3030990 RepID=UPI0024A396FD|nr:helix-turn-helix domain-containing protein [Microtetraspora sp. NBRC 13810]GLW08198.1 hypothetical protein Misp01_33280 [Microtetraspora sp. NBRC 13810]